MAQNASRGKKRNLDSLALLGSKNETIRILGECLREKDKKYTKPGLGQLLNILSRSDDTNIIIKDIKQYAFRKSALLDKKAFRDAIDDIKNHRNAIEHGSDQEAESFLSHFSFFRDNIIGASNKGGLLPTFLESLK